MKHAIVILEGAADAPLEVFDGRTPLEAVESPVLERLAADGRIGEVAILPDAVEPTDDRTLLALLGHDPVRDACGPAALEWIGTDHAPDDAWMMRLDLVTVAGGRLIDPAAGGLRTVETAELLRAASASLPDGLEVHALGDHRGVLIDRRDDRMASWATCAPAQHVEAPWDDGRPVGEGSEDVRAWLEDASALIGAHEINAVREDLGERVANALWAWGPGRLRPLPSLAARHRGVTGAIVSDHGLAGGLARHAGWIDRRVPRDLGPAAPADLAAAAIDESGRTDVVLVWCRTIEAASHAGDPTAKVAEIERAARELIAPLVDHLEREAAWRLLVVPGHATRVETLGHEAGPVPFLYAGTRVDAVVRERWTEATATASDLHVARGEELLEYALFGARMGTHE